MNILILGATGFIGSAIVHRLCGQGHRVVGIGRAVQQASRRMPFCEWKRVDLRQMMETGAWSDLLLGVDVVVNCAGALQDGLYDDLSAVHGRAMLSLYQAAAVANVRRIVQISVPRMDHATKTAFEQTKLGADAALAACGLDHVILRPAIVLGRNAHGGSALLRALAAVPLATPLIHGSQTLQTVWLDDVTQAVSLAVDGTLASGTDAVLAQPQSWTLAALVGLHRQWLGLSRVPTIDVPPVLARPVSRLADVAGYLGWQSPLRSTALAVTAGGMAGFVSGSVTGLPEAQDVRQALLSAPSGVQDLWFARLYLFKPVVIGLLSLFWLLSGLIPLGDITGTATRFGSVFAPAMSTFLVLLTCLADILLGLAVLWRPRAWMAMIGMIALSLAYLAGATLIEPGLWLDPLGPLVKVLPSIALAVISLAILDSR